MDDATTPSAPKKSLLPAVIIILVLAALGGGGYYFAKTKGLGPFASESESEQVVAIVNGKEVPYSDYEKALEDIRSGFTQQGLDVNDEAIAAQIKEQALNATINRAIILEKAAEAGINPSDEEVDGEYQKVVDSVGGEETLALALANLGRSVEELRGDLEKQLVIDRYVKENTTYESLSVSDEEVSSYYENIKAANGDELPPLSEVMEALRSELLFQKQQQVVSEFVDTLRADATVEILI